MHNGAKGPMVSTLLLRSFHALAVRTLTGTRATNLAFAVRLNRILTDLQIKTVIDVGANRGQYRDFLRDRVGFTGRIISFEPIPELAEQLTSRTRSDSDWHVRPVALGAETGRADLHIMSASVFSSFRMPAAAADVELNEMNSVVRTVRVPVMTLDEALPDDLDLRSTYVKLDTQGYDLEVMKGAPRTMSLVPALQTEVSYRPFYQETAGYQEAIAAFEQCGFAVADLFLVAETRQHVAMEFDCIMVRQT